MSKEKDVSRFTSPDVNPAAPPGQKKGAHPSASPHTQASLSSPTAATVDANWRGFGTAYFTPTKLGYSVKRRNMAGVTFGSRRYGTMPRSGSASAIAAWYA